MESTTGRNNSHEPKTNDETALSSVKEASIKAPGNREEANQRSAADVDPPQGLTQPLITRNGCDAPTHATSNPDDPARIGPAARFSAKNMNSRQRHQAREGRQDGNAWKALSQLSRNLQ
ncbi:hypothetical protein FNV43_RR05568 [Rhamnella rubrinervis]|uniref:Uncharacterized protein n=1 Tax=Rhamnella rubrinervis TaxID=2594499 RepID=A0A8K0MRQ9_9ROSA|nr:hypothetical protein FNV43_RR05568 [Rhamnella rubrinervis]